MIRTKTIDGITFHTGGDPINELWGTRYSYISPSVAVSPRGDEMAIRDAEEVLVKHFEQNLSERDESWKLVIVPDGQYKGKSVHYVYANDCMHIYDVLCHHAKEEVKNAAIAAMAYKDTVDPWSYY